MRAKQVFSYLGIGYGAFFAIILIIAGYAMNEVLAIQSKLDEINNVNAAKQRVAINFRGSVHDRSIGIRDVILYEQGDSESLTSIVNLFNKLAADYTAAREVMATKFESTAQLDEKEKNILARIDAIDAKANPVLAKIIEVRQKQDAKLMPELNDVKPLFVSWLATINEFIDYEEAKNQRLSPEVEGMTRAFLTFLTIGVIIALVLGAGLGIYIYRIYASVQEASDAMQIIADGNLAQPLPERLERGMLSKISTMRDEIRKMAANILKSSDRITANIAGVNALTASAAKAAEGEQASIQQSSQIITQLAKQSGEIAQKAEQTEANSHKTLTALHASQAQIHKNSQLIAQVAELVESSNQQIVSLQEQASHISTSIELISDIADQTNLLALNAAIESARAGDHGRGFAVVADEVRKLAEKTQKATNEITAMSRQINEQSDAASHGIKSILPHTSAVMESSQNLLESLANIEASAQSSFENTKIVRASITSQNTDLQTIAASFAALRKSSDEALKRSGQIADELSALLDISNDLKGNSSCFKLN